MPWMTLPMKVLVATSIHVKAKPTNAATAMTSKAAHPVCAAKPLRPVTQFPTGKVNDHQVSEKGRCSRAVRMVTMAAIDAQSSTDPSTGTP